MTLCRGGNRQSKLFQYVDRVTRTSMIAQREQKKGFMLVARCQLVRRSNRSNPDRMRQIWSKCLIPIRTKWGQSVYHYVSLGRNNQLWPRTAWNGISVRLYICERLSSLILQVRANYRTQSRNMTSTAAIHDDRFLADRAAPLSTFDVSKSFSQLKFVIPIVTTVCLIYLLSPSSISAKKRKSMCITLDRLRGQELELSKVRIKASYESYVLIWER